MALLELGEASVLRIAQKAALKRPTVYVTLEALLEHGLVERVPKGGKSAYQALDPDIMAKRFEERAESVRNLVPELRAMMIAAPHRPRVRVYEGKKNILNLYEEEIFCTEAVVAFVNMRELRKVFSRDELNGTLHIMKASSLSIRELLDDSIETREHVAEKNRLELGESRLLPPNFVLGIDLLVYADTVAMISPKNLIAVVIEDRAISASQKQFFEFVWKSCG